MSSSASSGSRSSQQIRPQMGASFCSDDIFTSAPQRPPRLNRQRTDSMTSPALSAIQQYQYPPHQRQQYEQSTTSSPPSSRQSPRSTPASYSMYSSQPSSPMSFQLPPSAMSPTREEPVRSGSISYFPSTSYGPSSPPIQIQIPPRSASSSAASSYRTPRLSPGLAGAGPGGLTMSSMPPLSLPTSLMQEHLNYPELSDVGFAEQSQQRETRAPHSAPIHPLRQSTQRRSTMDYPTAASINRHAQQQLQIPANGFMLPSPHLSPSTSPLSTEFPSLSLDPGNSPRFNTEVIHTRSDTFYHSHAHASVESFLMPSQEQYPPDSMILFGGTAAHSEGSLFRKDAKEYLLLTNSSLLKYKTMEKAVKVFGNQSIWSSSSGQQQLSAQQTSLIAKDQRILSLNSIVGVHMHYPPGSDMTIHIEYLVSISSQPASMHFTPSPEQAEAWLDKLRQGCNHHSPLAGLIPKGTRQRQWILEKLRDDHITLPQSVAENDPTALTAGGMWRAYFKSQRIKGVSSQEVGSAESKVSLEGKVIAIVVGRSFIHLLPHNLGNGSAKDEMKDERAILQYPILTTRAIQYHEKDDTFSLTFGTALRQRSVVMTFVSARAREIIVAIRARVESLRWLYPQGRKGIELTTSEQLSKPIPVMTKDYMPDHGFEDLLRAECHAMNIDRRTFSHVKIEGFAIHVGKAGDTADTKRDYSVDEMKCLLRALRFNTTFKEISFHDISFANLQKSRTLRDGTTRFGLRLDKEFYELVMGNPQLRVLDLHNCNLDTSTIGSIGRAIRDGATVGLRLEFLDLFGNNASDGADVMTLAKGLVKHAGSLNVLNVGNCQITGDGINQIMHAFVANADVASHTLEILNIEGNPECKVNSFILDMFLKHSMKLQQLYLSGLSSWSKSPILMAETLATCCGSLSVLDLSGMALHPSTLDQLLIWTSSPSFQAMEQLRIEGCGLDGSQFGSILEAIGESRNAKVEITAGKNLVSDGADLPESLVTILAGSDTPTSLGLRQTYWSEQALRQLFVSLSQNWSVKKLDLSAVSLGSNRDPDVETCKLLGQMISAPASRLEELYLRGEETVDLTSRIGKNLWCSFQGVGQSRYLTKLDVRRNRFRDEGALALAEALRINQSIVWLDMDENDVTLDGFNAILSAFHPGGTDHVPTSSTYYNSTLSHFEPPVKDVETQIILMKESMLETYKAEQETRFLLSNSTGKDSREWKERLAQIIRSRNMSSEAIARIERAIKGIANATERNKVAMDAVLRDRERRREREDRENQL